jgi:hypothetical protein
MVAHFRGLLSKPLVMLGIPMPVCPEPKKGITAQSDANATNRGQTPARSECRACRS